MRVTWRGSPREGHVWKGIPSLLSLHSEVLKELWLWISHRRELSKAYGWVDFLWSISSFIVAAQVEVSIDWTTAKGLKKLRCVLSFP